MNRQLSLLIAIIFALIIAVFAVINVDSVKVDYFFGTAEWPLILIILGSVLMGGFLIASAGIVRIYSIQRKLKIVEKENKKLKSMLEENNQEDHLPVSKIEEIELQEDHTRQS